MTKIILPKQTLEEHIILKCNVLKKIFEHTIYKSNMTPTVVVVKWLHNNPHELFCKEVIMTKKEVTSITNIVGNLEFADTMKIANIQRCFLIFQARILEWGAISSSRGSSQPRGWASLEFPALACGFFTTSATWEALMLEQVPSYPG